MKPYPLDTDELTDYWRLFKQWVVRWLWKLSSN